MRAGARERVLAEPPEDAQPAVRRSDDRDAGLRDGSIRRKEECVMPDDVGAVHRDRRQHAAREQLLAQPARPIEVGVNVRKRVVLIQQLSDRLGVLDLRVAHRDLVRVRVRSTTGGGASATPAATSSSWLVRQMYESRLPCAPRLISRRSSTAAPRSTSSAAPSADVSGRPQSCTETRMPRSAGSSVTSMRPVGSPGYARSDTNRTASSSAPTSRALSGSGSPAAPANSRPNALTSDSRR